MPEDPLTEPPELEGEDRSATRPREVGAGTGASLTGGSVTGGEVTVSTLGGLAGVVVGHWTDADARTGVTVVVLPEGTTASAEVRGGAPATREFDVLAPTATVTRLDAVVMSGGSAFGLAAVDGVVAALAEAGRGFITAGGVVPIVAGMSLFDLMVGSSAVRPSAAEGASATRAALSGTSIVAEHAVGAIGAGTGATVSKWRGQDHAAAGGLVTATVGEGGFAVSALVAVNAFGDVIGHGPADRPWPSLVPADEMAPFGADGTPHSGDDAGVGAGVHPAPSAGTNTTLGVIVTDAALTKIECLLLAQGAHDGCARAITPPHCRVDGDAVVAAATGAVPLADVNDARRVAEVELLRWMAVRAIADALATLADVAPPGPIPWVTPPAAPRC